jgi:hypothetical protein
MPFIIEADRLNGWKCRGIKAEIRYFSRSSIKSVRTPVEPRELFREGMASWDLRVDEKDKVHQFFSHSNEPLCHWFKTTMVSCKTM